MPTVDQHLRATEALRRVKSNPAITNAPVRCPAGAYRLSYHVTTPGESVDYGSAGLKIDLACAHLDEGIPNKQKERVEAAYLALMEGVFELSLWMQSNGYGVEGVSFHRTNPPPTEAEMKDIVASLM